jgi:ABC-type sugar transport system ATPase subunit
MGATENRNILEFHEITKEFPGVKALDRVSFSCRYGEVHGLVGENGAGKSTLMKILSGVYQPTGGHIIYKDQKLVLKNPHHAQMCGISIIFQEFSLIKNFDVTDNVFLNREPVNNVGHLNRKEARRKTTDLLKEIGFELDINKPISALSVVQQQVVEIVKALSVTASVVIMDEPSAALTDKELRKLFDIIRTLKQKGVTIIYISHMLEEIFEIADCVSVLKDGQLMGTKNIEETDKDELIRMMVGREIENYFPPRPARNSHVLMNVERLNKKGVLVDIGFKLHQGEILGLAGMAGSGRTMLAKCLLGIEPADTCSLQINGQRKEIRSIHQAIDCGIGYLPADRKNLGIIGPMDVRENMTLANLRRYLAKLFILKKQEANDVKEQIALLNIKTSGIMQRVENLSGGNQQKVIISRWLLKNPQIFIFAEPTRGIDVGAKAEIYRIMREVANGGRGIIMISSDLPEVIGMSDRILVMRSGRIEGCIDQHEKTATEEEIMSLAVGHQYALYNRGTGINAHNLIVPL